MVPPHLVDEWPVWRLVHAKMATMDEVTRIDGWTLREVDDANDVLDLFDLAAAPEE